MRGHHGESFMLFVMLFVNRAFIAQWTNLMSVLFSLRFLFLWIPHCMCNHRGKEKSSSSVVALNICDPTWILIYRQRVNAQLHLYSCLNKCTTNAFTPL